MMKHSRQPSYGKRPQGGVLIIVALSLVVLIGAMGLAFDSFLATTTRTQYQGVADRLALAVLEAYLYEQGVSGNTSTSINTAVTRAQELLALNVDLLLTKGFFANSGTQQDLQANINGSSSGANGYIQPGRWYESNPPCSANPSDFCALTQAEINAGDQPNAFHVRINVNPSSPIQTMFIKLLGQKNYISGARATAALSPRRAVFLIDLSGSIHDTTHDPIPSASNPPGTQSLYAYKLRTGIDCSGTTYPIPVSDILDIAAEIPAHYSGLNPADSPRYIYQALGVTNPTPGSPQANNRLHFQSDFECFDVDVDGDGNNDESYAIDVVTPPQPLVDVLEGIKQAMNEFKNRSVAGDRVMVAGFDDEILEIRTTHDVSGNPVLVPPNTPTGVHPEFQRILDAVDDPRAGSHIPALFFPRQWGRYGPGSPYLGTFDPQVGTGSAASQLSSLWGFTSPATSILPPIPAQTNLVVPINAARTSIKSEPNWQSADNFMVIFSDGKANCPNDGYLRAWGLPHYCSSTMYDFYQTGLASARTPIYNFVTPASSAAGENIAVHFALSGSSKPHTLLRPGLDAQNSTVGAPTGCLTDSQARAMSGGMSTFVLPYLNFSFPGNYAGPNELYSDVVKTGGLWVPLRNRCQNWSTVFGATGSLANSIEKQCQSGSALADGIGMGALTSYFFPGEYDTTCTDINGDGATQGCAARIFCDVQGRTISKQITDMFDKIMGSNPYVLVQ